MVSTFPSTSDVAWTDIFGDQPLPGYQRTYYSEAANKEVSINGVTTTMEHERQMDYQLQNGIFRALGYLHPVDTCRLEMFNAVRAFRRTRSDRRDFFVYLRGTDDAQHLDRDIMKLLCDRTENSSVCGPLIGRKTDVIWKLSCSRITGITTPDAESALR